MEEHLQERIARAKELLATVSNAAMATVNSDGTPHNTPFFFIRDDTLQYIYWCSYPDSLHSQNAERTGDIFVVLYEDNKGGGLYIKAKHAVQLHGPELEKALVVHNAMRAKEAKEPISSAYYHGDSPQRMYRATPTNFYVNVSRRGNDGYIIKEWRHEVAIEELTTLRRNPFTNLAPH